MIGDLLGIVGKFIPDANTAKKLEAEIAKAHSKALEGAVKADTEVRIAELKSGGLASKWRPISALIVFFTLFVRFPLYWLLQLYVGFFNKNIYLPILEDLPLEFFGLATAFVSIYAFGRSMEKRR